MKPISAFTDIKSLQQIMENAKLKGNDAVYKAAFSRRCELEGIDLEDPLEREFFATLAAYEELLKEKNGKTTRASYTRRALKNKGFVSCLEGWALGSTETDGFKVLVAKGMVELTGEYLVTKYPNRFSNEAVKAAQTRLHRIGTAANLLIAPFET